MKSKGLSVFTGLSVIIYLTLFVSIINAQAVDEKSPVTPLLLIQNTIAGSWQLNSAESDDVPKKIAQMIQNTKADTSQKKNLNDTKEELPTVSISLLPPEKLVLATDDNEAVVTINEGFNDITLSRQIMTDGKAREIEMSPGTNISVKAFQKQSDLIVETTSPRGNQLTESFVVTPDGKKLSVTLRIVDTNSQEILTLHRIYNRSILDILSNGASGENF